MAHVLLHVAERNDGYSRVLDGSQERREGRVELREQISSHVGRCGEDNEPGGDRIAAGAFERYVEGAVVLPVEIHGACFGDNSRTKFVCQSTNERFVAFAKRAQSGALPEAFFRFGKAQHATNDAA